MNEYLTADDLGVINSALAKGDDVRIVRVRDGIKIVSLTVKTLKKKIESALPKGS